MGKIYTEAQKKATQKYLSKTVAIQIRVTKEQRDIFKEKAKKNNMSLNQYVIYLLKNDNRIRELTESEKQEYNNLIKDSKQLEIEDILK